MTKEERLRIEFNCKECNQSIMVSVFPTLIDVENIEEMSAFCKFLNDGYIPKILSDDENPIKWCRCNKEKL